MSDYTPSTDRVSAAATEPGAQITPAEFDRWLESVRAEERERIARNIEARKAQEEQTPFTLESAGVVDGLIYAARIVREGA